MMRSRRIAGAVVLAVLAWHAGGCSAFDWSERRLLERWERTFARKHALPEAPNADRTPQASADGDDRAAARVGVLVSGARALRLVHTGGAYKVRAKVAGWGTATAVSEDGYFLTAAHNIGSDPLTLVCIDVNDRLRPVPARLVWKGDEETTDLALLHARVRTRCFEISNHPASMRNLPIRVAGFAELAWHVSRGRLLSNRPTGREPSATGWRRIIHTAPISVGDSGGPLLDHEGRLIGINSYLELRWWPFPPSLKARGFAVRPPPGWIEEQIREDRRRNRRPADD
jgi:S1-C subfamily serine protease